MTLLLLHLQLREIFRQWIVPEDKRHLDLFAENITAIMLSHPPA